MRLMDQVLAYSQGGGKGAIYSARRLAEGNQSYKLEAIITARVWPSMGNNSAIGQ